MNRLCCYVIALALLSYCSPKAWAQSDKVFPTQHTVIYYSQDNDLDDLIWRLGGQRLEFVQETSLASNRIDRLVNRVQVILDMWPENLKISVYLHRGALEKNNAAYYDDNTQAIHLSVDYASDGVLAHEIAHAVMNRYFSSPPPPKVKEILCQYVDQHLWSDY